MKFSMKKIMTNKYLLWAVFGLTIVNVFGYLANNQYNSLTFMVCVGLLTSFFNKNMLVILLVAVLSTALVNSRKIIEGMKSDDGEEPIEDKEEPIEDKEEPIEEPTEESTEEPIEEPTEESTEESTEEPTEKSTNPATEAVLKDSEMKQEVHKNSNKNNRNCYRKDASGKWHITDKVGDKCEESGSVNWDTCKGIDECKSLLKSGFSNMKSKNVVARASTEARVDGKDDFVNRIDSKATMSQTMSNLNNVIGKGGIKGLTKETKELLEQQKELVQSLGQMAPILKSAKSTLNGLDLPDISGLTNLLKGMNGN